MKLKNAFCLLLVYQLLMVSVVFGQTKQVKISGQVVDAASNPIPYASVLVMDKSTGTSTNSIGYFSLKLNVSDKIIASSVGYKSKIIEVSANYSSKLKITLESAVSIIDEVTISALSKKEKLKRTGFSLEILETKSLQRISGNASQLMKSISGINIRESGGLGSGFKLSLNGLTGKQVRYFIDGIPTDNLGQVFNLNNLPVGLLKEIVVYKGVVPIDLGADALGGAINVRTKGTDQDYLNASYSFGSFNTHLFSVVGNKYNKKKGFFISGQAYVNYSDNNYKMYDVPLVDELGNVQKQIEAKRFNDQYKSAFVSLKVGVREKRLADLLSLQLSSGLYRKNYQHSDFSTNKVFGKLYGQGNSWTAIGKYKKKVADFRISAYAMFGSVYEQTADTSTYRYNWQQKIISQTNGQGEFLSNSSLLNIWDKILQARVNLSYSGIRNSTLKFSYAPNYITRKGKDDVDVYNRSFSTPNNILKQTAGLAYEFQPEHIPLKINAFTKQYWYTGQVFYSENRDNKIEEFQSKPKFEQFGYGAALSYIFKKSLTFKLSFEKAFRSPESYEILGDGRYVLPNPDLQPESSYNWNTGFHFSKFIRNTHLISDFNLFYRGSHDFIRMKSTGNPFGTFENLSNVRSVGAEGGFKLNLNQRYLLSGNLTYQNITDQTPFVDGHENENFGQRIPNTPFLFANAGLAYNIPINSIEGTLTFAYNSRYVRSFSLTYEHLGNTDSKLIIPTQWLHDFTVDYSMQKDKYRVSLNALNLTNARVYDNFKVQKPGRSFYLKISYQFQ